jgi:hypothetical protein
MDDILVDSHDPAKIVLSLSALYCLKEDPNTGKKFDVPTQYLGSTIGQYTIPSTGTRCWFMSSDEYVKEAVQNIESELAKIDLKLKSTWLHPSSAF